LTGVRRRAYAWLMRALGAGVLVALVLQASAAPAEDGELDRSFGSGGVVLTPTAGTVSFDPAGGRAMVVQPDGRIVVAGFDANDLVVMRHLADGTPDPSFGVGGTLVTDPVGSDDDELLDMALQSDGRIVVVGWTHTGGLPHLVLARYDADGDLDATFGSGGLVVTPLGTGARGSMLALQSDGKIVVGITRTMGNDFAVARFASDGSLDTSFDGDGVLVFDLEANPLLYETPYSLLVQPDDKIVIGAWTQAGPGYVIRLAADGTLDSSFGTGGMKTLVDLVPSALALQPDGRLLVGGSLYGLFPGPPPGLARLLDDGTVDTGFAIGGFYYGIHIGAGEFRSIVVEPGGRIVAGGRRTTFDDDFLLARFESDGSLDAAFARCAVTITSLRDPGAYYADDHAYDVARLADGKILVAGGSDDRFALARYGTPALPACVAANSQRGKLVFKASRASISWRWQHTPTVPATFGDPLAATGYRFCIVDSADRPLVQATVPPATDLPQGWSTVSGGFKFGYPITVVPDGVTKMLLKASPATLGKVKLRMNTVPILDAGYLGLTEGPLVPPVTARLLRTDDDECFETVFSTPLGNTERAFRARSD
jgi:uncharacterized delta-60 repeat protein